MGAAARVDGGCEKRFAPLREVFANRFASGEIGGDARGFAWMGALYANSKASD